MALVRVDGHAYAKFLRLKWLVLWVGIALTGCTTVQRASHMYFGQGPEPLTYQYSDGGSSTYYSFVLGDANKSDTFIFFYGASGCPSWKSVMPDYVKGISVNARIFVLNKRFVNDRSMGLFPCGQDFHLTNNPLQWVNDYLAFIEYQVSLVRPKPKNVVLVGVSEGAIPATRVAGISPLITHLAIIGSGGYSMRKSLNVLKEKGSISFNVESGWQKVITDPESVEKYWYGNPYRWWRDVMDLEPLPDYLKLDIPILLGIGENDESVPVESALFLKAKFKQLSKENLKVIVYSHSDHRLNEQRISHRADFFEELSRLLELSK